MRMKPGPSSARHFSKYAQSTMSGRSSSNALHPAPDRSGVVPTSARGSRKRVKFSLAAVLVERGRPAPEAQPHRDRAEPEGAAHRVDQGGAIAFGQLVGAGAGHHERRRARLPLGG